MAKFILRQRGGSWLQLLKAQIILNSTVGCILLSLAFCSRDESTPSLFLSRSPVAFHVLITQRHTSSRLVQQCGFRRGHQQPLPSSIQSFRPVRTGLLTSRLCSCQTAVVAECVAQLQELLYAEEGPQPSTL